VEGAEGREGEEGEAERLEGGVQGLDAPPTSRRVDFLTNPFPHILFFHSTAKIEVQKLLHYFTRTFQSWYSTRLHFCRWSINTDLRCKITTHLTNPNLSRCGFLCSPMRRFPSPTAYDRRLSSSEAVALTHHDQYHCRQKLRRIQAWEPTEPAFSHGCYL